MKLPRLRVFLLALALLVAGLATPSPAQTSDVSSAEIQRLQDTVNDMSRDIAQARDRDARLGSQLQRELDQPRDEVTYLRVTAQKTEPITRSEYQNLSDRIDNIRSRARADGSTPPTGARTGDDRASSPTTPAGTAGRAVTADEIPVG